MSGDVDLAVGSKTITVQTVSGDVRLETPDGRIINGNGSDIDTLVASAKAYLSALTKLKTMKERLKLTAQ